VPGRHNNRKAVLVPLHIQCGSGLLWENLKPLLPNCNRRSPRFLFCFFSLLCLFSFLFFFFFPPFGVQKPKNWMKLGLFPPEALCGGGPRRQVPDCKCSRAAKSRFGGSIPSTNAGHRPCAIAKIPFLATSSKFIAHNYETFNTSV